ncbi:glycerate kinase [Thalassospiraceae bacterium LMO-JJ14]|nr:glycerate kinase [Thalassospiraceae bacterium LMO-JJ14]
MPEPKDLLRQLADAAIRAADPAVRVPPILPAQPKKAIVLGAGKASAAMARAIEQAWPDTELSGIVVTRYGYDVECAHIEIVLAAHPVPDDAGREAARRILEMAKSAGADDLVIALMSGGGSALLTAPADGISFADKQEVNRQLLRSGADIVEMNTIRKHISAIKGGRLAAAAHPARVLSILISDVPGDDPAVIGSGPTVPDPTTFADALAVVEKYQMQLPESVRRHLEAGADETPKPDSAVFGGNELVFAAKPDKSIEAAAEVARAAGYAVVDLGDLVEGEARDVGGEHAALALKCRDGSGPAKAPCVILSGGETTVTMSGNGRGGRNTEYLLGVCARLGGADGIYAVACDTDGVDGSEDNAGAFIDPTTLARAEATGLSVAAALANNDAYTLFDNTGDLLVTGPTYTNVNDFRAIVVT